MQNIGIDFGFSQPSVFGGVKIMENTLCTEPNKPHKKKRWMRDSYHLRIQKKWDKQFGRKPTAYITQYGIICHPSIADSLRHVWLKQQ